jgi:protein TonB
VGVTQGIKILSKPRPGYTDAARQANIQGTVILRVTFLASGQVGGISAVKGLPNGLTEQAIAAAHRISFEPAKVNGQAQSVTKQIEYTFSIY